MKTIKDFQSMIENNENFTFTKQGDGEIFCMIGQEGQNCDGHSYSKELGNELKKAYNLFNTLDNCYVTKWTDFDIQGDYVKSKGNIDGDTFLHNEISQDKYDFFKSLKHSKRKKIYVGPKKLKEVVNFLNIDIFKEIPEVNAFNYNFDMHAEENAIYLFSASMPAKIWIAKLLKRNKNITCIDIGSGFDPIFIGQTRTRQIQKEVLQFHYHNLLGNIPKTIFSIWLSDKKELPQVVKMCLESHKLEGYEHKLITLENCYRNQYIQDAIDAKQWGKACDYLRCYYLIEEGGIYLDADVFVFPNKNFDDYLDWNIFVGRENNGWINTAVMGATKGCQLLVDHLKEVEQKFKGNDGKYYESSLELITPRFDRLPTLESEVFYPYDHQQNKIKFINKTICIHWFMKTWIS